LFLVGTIRIKRFQNPPLLDDKELRKKGRVSHDTAVSTDRIVITKWHDNKLEYLASNFVGVGIQNDCTRWNKKQNTHIQVPRPESVRIYNINMGGVDKADFLLSLYRSHVRSRKWTLRMISHACDVVLVNFWLEYRKKAESLGIRRSKTFYFSFVMKLPRNLYIAQSHPNEVGQAYKTALKNLLQNGKKLKKN